MAIYSLNLTSVGKTTHAAGTAGAHMRYIGRERAVSEILAEHMPHDPQAARTWMDGHERDSRKNARLCDKLRIALPRELDEPQRAELIRAYMGELSQGRVPWYAAIHQTEKDAHNPHAHVVIVDRDIDTGKRVLGLSDSIRDREKKGLPGPSAIEWVRERWEHHANTALERAGQEVRIDRRSLKDQGIEREPQIHIGPRAQEIDTNVRRPESKVVPSPSPRHPDRVIDYPMIDAGRTRRERNAEIIDLNLERDARSPLFQTRVWAQFEREQRAKDRIADTQIIAANRRRTLEERRIRRSFAQDERELRLRRDAEGQFTRDWTKQRFAPEQATLKVSQADERDTLAQDQKRLLGRLWAAIDLSGRTRQRREEERQTLIARHAEERRELSERIRQARTAQAEAVRARYDGQQAELAEAKAQKLAVLRTRHESERLKDDAVLQARALDREKARTVLQQQIETQRQAERSQASAKQAKVQRASPARSQAAQDWSQTAQGNDNAADADEARKQRLMERWRKAREQRQDKPQRTRGRGYGHDMD